VGFARQVALTYTVRIVLVPVGLLYAAITARWLGPEGLGVFATIGAILGIASQFANLGMPVAVARFAAADERALPALVANARVTGAASGLLALVVLVGLYAWVPALFGEVPRDLVWIAALALPLTLAGGQFQAVLLARQRVRAYNFMEAMDRVLLLTGSVVALVILGLGLRALIVLSVVIAVVHWIGYHILLWPAAARLRPDPALARWMVGFSGRAYVAALLGFLVLRSDIVLLNAMRGSAETGLYSVAVRPTDFLLLLPAVAGTLLFPRIAARGDRESARFTATVARHVTLFMAAACACLAAVAWWAIPAVFGAEYRASVVPLWILLPGVGCMAIEGILANDLGGRDYPPAIIGIWAVLLLTNVGLNLWWIPYLGMTGAAAASTVAYGLSLVLMGRYWLRRFPEIRVGELFLPAAGDLRMLLERLRGGGPPPVGNVHVPTPPPGSR
jgi:O-antigen/teichoic acid export membrane protein